MVDEGDKAGLSYGELMMLTKGNGTSIIYERLTQFMRQVERETWEKAADELQSRYNRTWDISPFVLSFIEYCRQQAKERT